MELENLGVSRRQKELVKNWLEQGELAKKSSGIRKLAVFKLGAVQIAKIKQASYQWQKQDNSLRKRGYLKEIALGLKENIAKCFSEMETMALLEQDNAKDDILLEETGSLVERQNPQNRTKQAPTHPQN